MLSLRSLLIFRTVAETGSFTAAAEKLYVTQSAISHAIKDLEEETGLTLFDRLSRRVQLTAEGAMLLRESAPLLLASEQFEKRLADPKAHTPLSIVSSITIACFYLPEILRRFQAVMPEMPVNVKVVTAAEALEILQKGEAELAFFEGARPRCPFEGKGFAEYALKAVCGPGYGAGRAVPEAKKMLTLAEFTSERLLLREPGSAIRDTLDSQLFLKGYTVYPAWESVNSRALLEAAKAGLGIAVLPENLVDEELQKGNLREVAIEDLELKNELLAVWHRDKKLTKPLRTLLECSVWPPSAFCG